LAALLVLVGLWLFAMATGYYASHGDWFWASLFGVCTVGLILNLLAMMDRR
jgi:hypothetical protein